jgi:hypothetical protein
MRLAIFLMLSGDLPVAFAISSNDLEERASSIRRRSSLKDQRRGWSRVITKKSTFSLKKMRTYGEIVLRDR